MRKGTSYTVSHGTGHHLFLQNGVSPSEFEPTKAIPPQLLMPMPPLVPPKKRNSTTLTLRNKNSQNGGDCKNGNGPNDKTAPTTMGPSTLAGLNPKRVSVATSTFWDGHPDVGHLVRGWELGLENNRPGERSSLWGSTFDPSKSIKSNPLAKYDSCTLLPENSGDAISIWGDPPAVKKGILLQQRDKLLARWKERYCILTRDYLHCFRRTSSIHRSSGLKLSEMGNFIFKLRLAEIDEVEWESRRNCSVLIILLPNEPKILVRVPGDNAEILRQWYTLLQECIYTSKERRTALRHHASTTISSRSVMSLLSDGSSPTTTNSSTGSRSQNSQVTTSSNSSSSSSNDEDLSRRLSSSASPKFTDKTDLNSNKKKYAQLLTENHESSSPTNLHDGDYEEPKVILRRDLKKNKISGQTTSAADFMMRHSSVAVGPSPETLSPPPKVPARKNTVTLGSGYSIPIDYKPSSPVIISYNNNINNTGHSKKSVRRSKRPESWAPAAGNESLLLPPSSAIPAGTRNSVAYRSTGIPSTLIPNHNWTSNNNNNGNGTQQRMSLHHRTFSNCGSTNNSNNNINSATPSVHTSEISFRKIC